MQRRDRLRFRKQKLRELQHQNQVTNIVSEFNQHTQNLVECPEVVEIAIDSNGGDRSTVDGESSFLLGNGKDNIEEPYHNLHASDNEESVYCSVPCERVGDDNSFDLRKSLHFWAVECQVPHRHLTKLLQILRHFHADLPQDARTLLCTPTSTTVREIGSKGEYCHIGVKNALLAVNKNSNCLLAVDRVELQFNVDGLPIAKSSDTQLWPILGRIINPFVSKVFTVGVYSGKCKPESFNALLHDFVEEMKFISEAGGIYLLNGHRVSVAVKNFICDTPARADMKLVKHHNFRFGCDKCTQEGEHLERRMTFQYKAIPDPQRKDLDFVEVAAGGMDGYIVGESALLRLNVGMVSQFPLYLKFLVKKFTCFLHMYHTMGVCMLVLLVRCCIV